MDFVTSPRWTARSVRTEEEGEQRSLLDRGSIASIQIPLAAYLQQAKFLAPKTQSSYPEEGRYV